MATIENLRDGKPKGSVKKPSGAPAAGGTPVILQRILHKFCRIHQRKSCSLFSTIYIYTIITMTYNDPVV